MFEDRRCAAMLPASDVERAKSWFADSLLVPSQLILAASPWPTIS